MNQSKQVKLLLVDPMGLREACDVIKERFLASYAAKNLFLCVTSMGQIVVSDTSQVIYNHMIPVGKFTFRTKKREVAIRGILLEDMVDEIIDCLQCVGLSAVYIQGSSI